VPILEDVSLRFRHRLGEAERVGDIYIATALVGAASLVTLLLGLRLGRRLGPRAATFACVLIVGLIVLHVRFVSGRLWVTRVVPASSAVVLGNALLPAVAALAGLAWRLVPGGVPRRLLVIGPLVGLCAYGAFAPAFPRASLELVDRWRDDVCLQTSPATCAPAASATLLRAHRIDTTESEMAWLCLTGMRGTSDLGLYRGLRVKTRGTPWAVTAFHTDVEGLRQLTGPAILTVRLEAGADVDPRYEQLWGWTPGVSHTVVFFGFTDDGEKVVIGDPGTGREHWSVRDLHVLWHGDGLRLAAR
jgi:hypothetical protein